jgi:hypothetical protein
MTPPLDLTQKPSSSWIDVRYTAVGGVTLDVASFADEAREFALSGSGVGGAASAARRADVAVQQQRRHRQRRRRHRRRGRRDGLPLLCQPRFPGRLGGGQPSPAPTGPTPTATAASMCTEAFQVIETLKDNGQSGQSVGRVFYIEISGGIKLQGLGFTDEPIIDIRGKVTLEIGDFQLTNGNIIKRFTIDASAARSRSSSWAISARPPHGSYCRPAPRSRETPSSGVWPRSRPTSTS